MSFDLELDVFSVQQMEFLVQVAVYTAIDYIFTRLQRALSHSHCSRQNEGALFYLALIAVKTLQGGLQAQKSTATLC